MQPLSQIIIKELIVKMADDELILGHRNSEWTGLGPVMEEDIAFSSMAQDKIGHALALYNILQEQFGEKDPDHFAFLRKEKEYKCCHLVEIPGIEPPLPAGGYEFSLMRHFLFDHAETIRYESLADSSFEPLRPLSKKFKGELKYHTLHANAWLTQLGHGSEEGHARMQVALNECFPLALGIFEPGKEEWEQALITGKVYIGEKALQQRWIERIYPVLSDAALNLPDMEKTTPVYGGRHGFHTEYLQPLLDEMSEVFRLDPGAGW